MLVTYAQYDCKLIFYSCNVLHIIVMKLSEMLCRDLLYYYILIILYIIIVEWNSINIYIYIYIYIYIRRPM